MDTIPPQPTVLVTGAAECQLRSVAFELFDERTTGADGAVAVTTREPPAAMVDRLTSEADGISHDGLAVVDVRGVDDAGDDPDVGHLVRVDPGADPERVDEAVTSGLEWLADAGVDRRHFLYDTLATNARLPTAEAAYDRAYRIAMSVGCEEGIALFTLENDGLSADVVEQLGHLVDVQVELRRTEGDTELRWTGLLGTSDGWTCLDDADLGVGGFR